MPQDHELGKIFKEQQNLENEKKLKKKTQVIKMRSEMGILPKKKATSPNPLSVKKRITKENDKSRAKNNFLIA